MKRILLLMLIVCFGMHVGTHATPPLKRTFVITQVDGTKLTVKRSGGCNGTVIYSTEDGIALVRDRKTKGFCYAKTDGGKLVSSGITAHSKLLRTNDETSFLSTQAVSAVKAYRLLESKIKAEISPLAFSTTGSDGLGIFGKSANGVVKSIGSPVIPVIMVEFPDCPFQETTTQDKLTKVLNEEGYTDEFGSVGSAADYFKSQSAGAFTPSFKIVDRVNVSKPRNYYGQNSGGNIDVKSVEFVKEAVDSALSHGVDFSQFTESGTGKVPLVSIFHAGFGEHSTNETVSGCDSLLWAHFRQVSINAGTVGINSYFVGDELLPTEYSADGTEVTKFQFDGIGVFIHEFSHALGLPDFYYTGNNAPVADTLQTMGYWSVMDYGHYMYNGYAPQGYNAYERSCLGWLQLRELSEKSSVTIKPFSDFGNANPEEDGACLVRNPNNSKEYYIFENRQPSTWYSSLFRSGMLITHVDYNASAWSANTVNNVPSHQRFAIVPADSVINTYTPKNVRGDLWPGRWNNATSFTDTTIPASVLYSGGYLSRPIYDITQTEDGLIKFSFLERGLTGIESVIANAGYESGKKIYTTDGRLVSTVEKDGEMPQLPSGIYIIMSGNETKKAVIK